MARDMLSSLRRQRSYKNLEIAYLDIKDLVSHEFVDYNHFKHVLEKVKVGRVVKPIIVDNVKNIVIDGHHRIEVLKLMDLKVVPALVASYGKDIHRIGSWTYIAYLNEYTYRLVRELIKEFEYNVKRGDKKLCIKIGNEDLCLFVDAIDFYLLLNDIRRGREFKAFAKIFKKTPYNLDVCRGYSVCIVMPKLSVEDIYRIALKGVILPPRTTYHITYLKKVDIFIPLSFLAKISKRL